MATALDTLCGQAYGAKKYRLLGIYLQRGLIVLNLSAIPFALIYLYMGEILQWLGQDPDIAEGAGQYTRYLIPALFGTAVAQCYSHFLLSQTLVLPILWSGIATIAVHVPLCCFLVYSTPLGFLGGAVATSASSCIAAVLLALYASFSKHCEQTHPRLSSWEAFQDLKSFILLALPSTAMMW
jgi:MATE family multidrug resistance protein